MALIQTQNWFFWPRQTKVVMHDGLLICLRATRIYLKSLLFQAKVIEVNV